MHPRLNLRKNLCENNKGWVMKAGLLFFINVAAFVTLMQFGQGSDAVLSFSSDAHPLIRPSSSASRSLPPPAPFRCSPASKNIFGEAFKSKSIETTCPTFPYGDFLSNNLNNKQAPPYGVISIGCNKGDDLLRQASIFSPLITEKGVYDHISSFTEASKRMFPQSTATWHMDEGTCSKFKGETEEEGQDVTMPAPPFSSATHPTKAVCVEPLAANFDVLSKISGGMSRPPLLSTTLVNAAISDFNGIAKFPVSRVGAGYEQAGLNFFGWGKTSAKDFVDVEVLTLDSLLKRVGMSYVNYLSIDVEGEDATVLKGAFDLFKTGKVGFVEFEINTKGSWASTSFEDVIRKMESADYECYFSVNEEPGVLIPLSVEGNCFSAEYNKKRWGNAACLLRGTQEEKAIRDYAIQFVEKVEKSGNWRG